MKGNLYILLNKINGKKYVGKTYRCIENRFKEHISDSFRYDRPLHRAIRKYGANSFELLLLGEFEEKELEIAEQNAIIKHNSYGSTGYNATLGGDGKRFLNIPDSKVLEMYSTLKTVFKVANLLKIDDKTVRKILKAHNIEIIVPPKPSISVAILDPYMEFNSFRDCAQFLKDCELTAAKDLGGIGSNIRRAIENNKTYLGVQFSFPSSEQANAVGC